MQFKTVLASFVLFFLGLMIGAVFFVQSEYFGKMITKFANEYIEKHVDLNLKIESVDISFFPPGLEVNNVQVSKTIDETSIKIDANQIGVYVGVVNIEDSHFSLGEVRVSNALVDITKPDSDEPDIEKIDRKLIKQIFNYQSYLPIHISNVLIENTILKMEHELLEVKKLRVIKDNNFILRFYLANLNVDQDKSIIFDELYGDLVVGPENVQVRRIRLVDDVHTLILKGDIKSYPDLKDASANFIGETVIHMDLLEKYFEMPEIIKIDHGVLNSTFSLNYKNRAVESKADVGINELLSSVANAENIQLEIIQNSKEIKIASLNFKNHEERLTLLRPAKIYDLTSKKVLSEKIEAKVLNIELNNALRVLPSLEPLKGRLTGEVAFSYLNGDLKFVPKDGFQVNDLRLVVNPEKPFEILKIKQANLSSSTFDVINEEFRMVSTLKAKNSLLAIKGMASAEKVNFEVLDGIIDLEDLGNISQLDIKGAGKLNIIVKGPLDDVGLNINGQTNNFEVLGYKLGQTNKDLTIMLKDSDVIIHNVIGKYKSTPIHGNGLINYDDLNIHLDIKSSKTNYHDLKEILDPIFSKLDFLPEDLDFHSKLGVKILGKTTMKDLVIKGDVEFQDLYAYGESLSQGNFQLNLENELLSLSNLQTAKNNGKIEGYFQFDMKDDFIDLDYKWSNIPLSSFNAFRKFSFNFEGLVAGRIRGGGKVSDYNLNLSTTISDTKSSLHKYEDSVLFLGLTPHSYIGNAKIFGNIFKADFEINTGKKDRSSFTFVTNIEDAKPYAIAILGNHLESENFFGRLKYKLDASFTNDLKDVDFVGQINEAFFEHESFKVNYLSQGPEFIVKNSRIEKWNLNIDQPDFKVHSQGKGEFSKEVSIYHNTDINSKILEILIPSVLSADGYIFMKSSVVGRFDDYDLKFRSHAEALSFTIDSLPIPLNRMKYDIEFKDNRLVVKELESYLENGKAKAYGDIYFDDAYPDINLKYNIDKAEIPVLGKSLINVSGDGIIIGNYPPYSIGGEIQVNKAHIVNELSEFSTKTNALSQIRFLPEDQDSQVGKWFNLNLNVKTMSPVKVTNSLMDISLVGELSLNGNPIRPRGEGSLSAPVNTSRVFFKNNEYVIQKADLIFNQKKEITNPDFDIHAVTNISSYRVDAKAYGSLERFNFDLTSDPVLTRNSILSLIAFGYSDEIQSTLTQDQQQNLTQVGVGSFVFDRFKISDILNKQFGLQVNLGTVFEQSQTQSLLSGRSQDGQGVIGRTRTATKIELKKRLDEALNLSVSSTMGGSIGQRQSMNLNYSINSKVQVEGVYELRTNDEGQEDVIDNSIGGDLKFRWTFK